MRNPQISAGFLSIVLALMMSLSAAGQSATPSSPQQVPPTAAPSQTPAAAPSQSPTTSQPAAGQAGAGASTSQGSAPSQAQKEDENPLNLTDDQKAKLRPILMEENQQMDAVRNDSSLTTDQKVAKANEIRQTASPKIRAILTPEQIQKLAELQQKAKQQNPSAPADRPKK